MGSVPGIWAQLGSLHAPPPVCPLPRPRAGAPYSRAEEGALRPESGVRAAPPQAQLLCVAVKRPSIGLFGQCRAVCLVVTGSKVGIVPRGRLLLPQAGRGPLTLTRAGRLQAGPGAGRALPRNLLGQARARGLGDSGGAARVWAGVPPSRPSLTPSPGGAARREHRRAWRPGSAGTGGPEGGPSVVTARGAPNGERGLLGLLLSESH